ncbi:MAG: glutamyl-tRNA reductase [Oscillospiraceae bacterium]|nr:glutamyl-tRNA reductase [Oscillospiraceae bacterium]
MEIQMIGIDHSLAPVEIRERFSFTTTAAQQAMEEVFALPDVEGCVLLSTCNRTELWVDAAEMPGLPKLFCGLKGLPPEDYAPYLTVRRSDEAVQYLFELASGLHSRILGEDQVLAQVKTALARARELQCCGSVLEVLFRNAVTGAKRVKSELMLQTANASAAELAIQKLRAGGMDFRGKHCLVIGNGEMGRRAAAALLESGATVTVTVRQYRSGNVEVTPGCARIDYGERYRVLPGCEVVISATSSPNITLRRAEIEACGLSRDTLFLDFAVPRDIDPEVGLLPHATLYDIDWFSVPESEELRQELRETETLIREQKEKFMVWAQCRDLIPAVDELGGFLAEEAVWRTGGAVKALGLTADAQTKLTDAVSVSAGSVLKKLLFAVRDEAGAEVFRRCVEAMEGEIRHA